MSTAPWRRVIVEQLGMLASEAEQLGYERRVPHVDITKELVCGWFDDSYHPKDIHFCSCFTHTELDALAEFDAVFEQCIPDLPKSEGTILSWHSCMAWRKVMAAADTMLSRFSLKR